jgi:glycosyltransferase involved in cell wall biosynthesis
MRPFVSVVVPSFNQGQFIRETLESCLTQDHRPLEVLVIDGGSTDDTLTVLRATNAPELIWVSEPDRGVVDAVNKGLARARGEYITIQSSDDVFLPGALAAAVDALEASPAAAVAYGDVELIDTKSAAIGADVQERFDLAEYLGRFMYVPQPGTVFTRAALGAVGGWREQFSYVADADFWLRIAVRFPILKLPRMVARYRYHPGQRDQQRAKIARDWEGAVRDLLAGGALSARQRRFARMGIHLARYRYAPERAWISRTRDLYAAVLANPAAVTHRYFPRRELLPGRDPIWRALSRAKRALGLPPRRA